MTRRRLGRSFPLDLDLMDHIEVVRGPGSSLFGTNAIFGVINVITRSGSRKAAVEVYRRRRDRYWSRSGRATIEGDAARCPGCSPATCFRTAGEPQLYFPVFASPATNNGYAENADGAHLEQAFADLRDGEFPVAGNAGGSHQAVSDRAARLGFQRSRGPGQDARGYLDLQLRAAALRRGQRIRCAATTTGTAMWDPVTTRPRRYRSRWQLIRAARATGWEGKPR